MKTNPQHPAHLTDLLKLKRRAAENALSQAVLKQERLEQAIMALETEVRTANGEDPHLERQRAAFSNGYFNAAMRKLGALRLELIVVGEDRTRAELALKKLVYAEDRLRPPGGPEP